MIHENVLRKRDSWHSQVLRTRWCGCDKTNRLTTGHLNQTNGTNKRHLIAGNEIIEKRDTHTKNVNKLFYLIPKLETKFKHFAHRLMSLDSICIVDLCKIANSLILTLKSFLGELINLIQNGENIIMYTKIGIAFNQEQQPDIHVILSKSHDSNSERSSTAINKTYSRHKYFSV